MPTNPQSPRLTDAYRERLLAIRGRLERDVRAMWPRVEDLDVAREAFPVQAAERVALAQREAARATLGYLTGYLTLELGRRVRTPRVDARKFAGVTRDGRPLKDAMLSPVIGTLAALRTVSAHEALSLGRNRALRLAGIEFDHAHRASLADLMERDPRITGWQRAVRGTCGACLGDIAVEVSVNLPGIPLKTHPYCMCVTQPVVKNVPDRFPLKSGVERFVAMTAAEQDEQFGQEKADLLRKDPAQLAALVAESHQETADDFITEAPTAALT